MVTWWQTIICTQVRIYTMELHWRCNDSNCTVAKWWFDMEFRMLCFTQTSWSTVCRAVQIYSINTLFRLHAFKSPLTSFAKPSRSPWHTSAPPDFITHMSTLDLRFTPFWTLPIFQTTTSNILLFFIAQKIVGLPHALTFTSSFYITV